MLQRERALFLGLVLGATWGCSEPPPPSGTGSRPDVLILIADDLACSVVGAFGGLENVTPAIDRLAARGLTFQRACSTASYCTPARQALLTGRLPHHLRVTRLKTPLPRDALTLGTLFRASGYATAAIGKMHWNHVRGRDDHGFDLILDRGDWRNQLSTDERRSHDEHRRIWMSAWSDPERRYEGLPLELPIERTESHWLVERTLEFIDAPRERPFLAICSFSPPHFPFTYPAAHEAPPELAPVPEFDHQQRRRNVPGIAGTLPRGGLLKPAEARRLRAAYARSAAWLDSQLGLLMEGLEQRGREPVIVFLSDQGFLSGEHGLVGKLHPYREVLRVPLILRLPGRAPAQRTELVSLVDVLPTLCELAGIVPPGEIQGRSLLPLLDGRGPAREAVFAARPGFWAAVRTDDWKLVLGAQPALGLDQLYDLRADPGELTNLFRAAPEGVTADLVTRLFERYRSSRPEAVAPEAWMQQRSRINAVRWALQQREPESPNASGEDD